MLSVETGLDFLKIPSSVAQTISKSSAASAVLEFIRNDTYSLDRSELWIQMFA